ncbi:MAG: hpch/hpai aldolase [Rhodobiaceae bacterium]|nr:hpch/hpai aldolase [Rhodobiaceae bacterium]
MATFKELLATKRLKVGTYIGEFATPGIGQMLKVAGCEFAFVDMEHSGFGYETTKALLRHLHDAGIATVTRPPSKTEHHIARACDVGAQGLIPPMMGTAEQAQTLVKQIKYPTAGTRGAAFGIAHDDYLPRSVADVVDYANAKTSAVALIETAEGVANADAIAATDGIDCLWIGHFDLSNSLGIPGQFDKAAFKDAVKTVMGAGAASGKSVGRLTGSPDEAEALFAQGCDFICYSGDIWLFTGALTQGVSAVRDRIGDALAGGR